MDNGRADEPGQVGPRRWVADYRVRLRNPLNEVPLQFLVLIVLTPVGCLVLAWRFLADGTWWQRLLAVPLTVVGVVLLVLEFWYLQRPRRTVSGGWSRAWFGPRRPGSR